MKTFLSMFKLTHGSQGTLIFFCFVLGGFALQSYKHVITDVWYGECWDHNVMRWWWTDIYRSFFFATLSLHFTQPFHPPDFISNIIKLTWDTVSQYVFFSKVFASSLILKLLFYSFLDRYSNVQKSWASHFLNQSEIQWHISGNFWFELSLICTEKVRREVRQWVSSQL